MQRTRRFRVLTGNSESDSYNCC